MKSALKTLTRIQKFQIDEQRKILSEPRWYLLFVRMRTVS